MLTPKLDATNDEVISIAAHVANQEGLACQKRVYAGRIFG
jgi:hypothetical protein